jgi:hypothetical protein
LPRNPRNLRGCPVLAFFWLGRGFFCSCLKCHPEQREGPLPRITIHRCSKVTSAVEIRESYPLQEKTIVSHTAICRQLSSPRRYDVPTHMAHSDLNALFGTFLPFTRKSIESLSLGSGAILLAIISTFVVWLLSLVCPVVLHKFLAVIVPLTLAYCLFWLPVWLGADSFGYGTWEFVFIIPWFLAGLIPSWIIVGELRKRRG